MFAQDWRTKWKHASAVPADLVERRKDVNATSGHEKKRVRCTDAARTTGTTVTSVAVWIMLCCVLLRTLREDDASIEHVGGNSGQLTAVNTG